MIIKDPKHFEVSNDVHVDNSDDDSYDAKLLAPCLPSCKFFMFSQRIFGTFADCLCLDVFGTRRRMRIMTKETRKDEN